MNFGFSVCSLDFFAPIFFLLPTCFLLLLLPILAWFVIGFLLHAHDEMHVCSEHESWFVWCIAWFCWVHDIATTCFLQLLLPILAWFFMVSFACSSWNACLFKAWFVVFCGARHVHGIALNFLGFFFGGWFLWFSPNFTLLHDHRVFL